MSAPPRFDPFEAAQLGALCGFLLSLALLVMGVLHNPYGWKPIALTVLGFLAGWVIGALREHAYAAEVRRRREKK